MGRLKRVRAGEAPRDAPLFDKEARAPRMVSFSCGTVPHVSSVSDETTNPAAKSTPAR